MGTPANSLNLITPGIIKFDGVSTFSSTNLTNHSVLVGNPNNSIASVLGQTGQLLQSNGLFLDPTFTTATYPTTAGTSGKVLVSDGTNIVSSTPTFPNASATSGKFIRSDGTNWIASTPTLPTSAGTSGKVLQSNGTNYVESTPTYPSTSGTSGKILISDGTNNVYSTPTYPAAAGTSGNILTSDGTNWLSSTPAAGGVTSVSGTTDRITSTGGATPVIDIAATYVGQTSITTLGTIATGTWSGTTIAANKGGTGQVTNTNHGVLLGQGASAIAATAAGSAGQVLQSGGGSADPTYSTATFPSTATGTSKVLVADGTNWVASTPTFPNASATSGKFIRSDGTNWVASTPTLPTSAGTAGKVLMSNATNYIESTPTYPSTSGTSRKILVSDGTNNVYSTETWAVPGTSGNVLTSDGTNWTSSASSSVGNLLVATLALTNTQIKNLRGTPIQIVAAPGAGKAIIPVSATAKLVYGGTNVFTAAGAQNIGLYWNNSTTAAITASSLLSQTMIISSASKFSYASAGNTTNVAAGIMDNVNVAAFNNGSAEIGGNAANDNTINITFTYFIVTNF